MNPHKQKPFIYLGHILPAFAHRILFWLIAKSIPAQQKKERIILEVIVQAFDHDRIYSEREVNILIADFYDNFCTIRRDMVGERLLARDTSGYWRAKTNELKNRLTDMA